MAQTYIDHEKGGRVSDGGLTIDVPPSAVPPGTTVALSVQSVQPPDPATADGLPVLKLWKVTATPPTALNLAARLSTPLVAGRGEAQQQFRLQDQKDLASGGPIPIGWIPLDDLVRGNAQTDGNVGFLPPFSGAPESGTTWVALVAL
jgi:hypothetical protein